MDRSFFRPGARRIQDIGLAPVAAEDRDFFLKRLLIGDRCEAASGPHESDIYRHDDAKNDEDDGKPTHFATAIRRTDATVGRNGTLTGINPLLRPVFPNLLPNRSVLLGERGWNKWSGFCRRLLSMCQNTKSGTEQFTSTAVATFSLPSRCMFGSLALPEAKQRSLAGTLPNSTRAKAMSSGWALADIMPLPAARDRSLRALKSARQSGGQCFRVASLSIERCDLPLIGRDLLACRQVSRLRTTC